MYNMDLMRLLVEFVCKRPLKSICITLLVLRNHEEHPHKMSLEMVRSRLQIRTHLISVSFYWKTPIDFDGIKFESFEIDKPS